MENATQALLIAGGILIAILIITVLVRVGGNISSFQKSQLTEEQIEEIEALNSGFTKYLGQYVYGIDLITVVNKAIDLDNNISVNTKFIDNFGSIRSNQYVNLCPIINEDLIKEIKGKAFKCTEVDYDNLGRVNSIKFEEKQWNGDSVQ